MTLSYCYDIEAKKNNERVQARMLRAAAKLLPEFQVTFRFNPGGIAVWGEHIVKITRDGHPVAEAIVSRDYLLVRQWDGRDSGPNVPVRREIDAFATAVTTEAGRPFQRF